MKPLQEDAQKESEEGAESEGFIHEKFVLRARPLLLTPADVEAAKSPRAMATHTIHKQSMAKGLSIITSNLLPCSSNTLHCQER